MEQHPLAAADGKPLHCHRCDRRVERGKGQFYVVRLDAICDPSPPSFSDKDLEEDFDAEIARLSSEIQEKPEQELVDQVYRRKFLCLCTVCYRGWIENPVAPS